MGFNYRALKEHYTADAVEASRMLKESFTSKQIKPQDIDLGRLFEEIYGMEEFRACRSGVSTVSEVEARAGSGRALREEGAVSTSMFTNITGQIVYSTTLDAYNQPDFTVSRLFQNVPTKFLDGEKIAGINQIGNRAVRRNENDPYALASVGEDWIMTPSVIDRGFIVPVSWEAVFADRTGQLLERCGEVGYEIGYNKEVRAVDCLIDENTTDHRYNWRTYGKIASYGANSGTHTWANLQTSNALVDWNNLNTVEQLFNQLLNPYTGQPIMIEPKHLVVAKQLEQTANRVIRSTTIAVNTPGYATTGNPTQANMANPYSNKYEIVTSQLLYSRMALATSWFLGNYSKYAVYMEAEPFTVLQAPANNEDEFSRRIVAKFRANERGAFVVKQPRAAVKSTA